jgi:hypothetical protein
MKHSRLNTIVALIFGFAMLAAGMICIPGCGNTNRTPAQEIQAWDAILQHSVAVIRATVAAQPAGPKRDKLLAQIDAIANWEMLAAAVSAAVAEGVTVPPVATTQPTK